MKPETTHTPGPWAVGVAGNANVVRFNGDDITGVASVANPANAHLIAAAPELYEALKELVEMLRAEAPGTTLNNHRFDALGIKANNALLKAEGRR